MNKILLALFLILIPSLASAQSSRNPCFYNVSPSSTDGCTSVSSSKPLPVTGAVSGITNVTPTDCSGTITLGGTAQNAITAQTALHGFAIVNIDASAGGGEPIAISFTGTAALNSAGSYPLAAPAPVSLAGYGSFTTPFGFGTNHAISVIGATTGHKFSCTWW